MSVSMTCSNELNSNGLCCTPNTKVAARAMGTITSVLAGALAGRILQTISPVGGAICGLVSEITAVACDEVREKLKINSTAGKICFVALKIFASIGASFAALKALGFHATLTQVAHLSAVSSLIALGAVISVALVAVIGFSAYAVYSSEKP